MSVVHLQMRSVENRTNEKNFHIKFNFCQWKLLFQHKLRIFSGLQKMKMKNSTVSTSPLNTEDARTTLN